MKIASLRTRAALCGVMALIALSSASADLLKPREVDVIPASPPDHTIAYGSEVNQFGQLFLPQGPGPFPVAVIIHGGCWKKFADLKNTVPMSDTLRKAGIATWNIEYRRVDNEGGGWPGTYLDVAAAIDHLRQIGPQYHLDLERVITVGHSAGGHLALWAAARQRLPKSSQLYMKDPLPIQGVVNLAGPGKLQSLSAEQQQKVCGSVPVTQLLGGEIDLVPQRVREGSPGEMLPLGVPQIMITGSLDHLVPPTLGEEYAALARKSGDEAQMIVIEGAGHFEVIAPGTAAWPSVEDAVLSLVKASTCDLEYRTSLRPSRSPRCGR
jgi:acetyl esterase/lipase